MTTTSIGTCSVCNEPRKLFVKYGRELVESHGPEGMSMCSGTHRPPRDERFEKQIASTVKNARLNAVEPHLDMLEQRVRECIAIFTDDPAYANNYPNPAAHDAWQLALQHIEPLRAAISRALKAGFLDIDGVGALGDETRSSDP